MEAYLILILSFAFIGVLDTLYLAYHSIKKTDVACWFFPKEWCKKVQYSSYSKTLGVPNSFFGLGMYLSILLLTFLFMQGVVPFWCIQAVILFGFTFSIYFTFVQAFILKAFCTWCVISAINFVVLMVAAFVL